MMSNGSSLASQESISTACDVLSGLLLYPHRDYLQQVESARKVLENFCPKTIVHLEKFLERVRKMESVELEEQYVTAFELDPSGILYTGIHLFGEESFKRGAFMAELNARYREFGIDHGIELPDHVSVVLKYYARARAEDREELARHVLLGTLEKMISKFDSSMVFKSLLEAVLEAIRTEFPNMNPAPFPVTTEASLCATSGGNAKEAVGCASGCGMVGAGMGDRDFLTSEEESI